MLSLQHNDLTVVVLDALCAAIDGTNVTLDISENDVAIRAVTTTVEPPKGTATLAATASPCPHRLSVTSQLLRVSAALRKQLRFGGDGDAANFVT